MQYVEGRLRVVRSAASTARRTETAADSCGRETLLRPTDAIHPIVYLARFALRVLRDFQRNRGLLLSGAIAYYTFFSIIPMSLLGVSVLSHFLDSHQLLQIFSTYMGMVIPGYAVTLTDQVQNFIEHRTVIGVAGFVAMLFFSSIAFSMLENAMSVIFFHRFRGRGQRRNFLVTAILPYLYMILIALGIVAVSYAVGAIEALMRGQGSGSEIGGVSGMVVYLLGIVGEFLILSSVYLVMPGVRVTFRYALIGGLTATILWEITRRLLVWYYSAISMVDLIYGPIAIAIAALVSVEFAAIIVLLGAQVIAELLAPPDDQPVAPELQP